MASVSTYLNFPGYTEEAFNFYKSVFGGEFFGNGIIRFGDVPAMPDGPPMPESEKNLVMYVELRILGVHSLMGTDVPGSMREGFTFGQAMNINVQPDTREETRQLFQKLSEGGKITMPLEDMFWGDYFGSCTDKYGIEWMFNCAQKQ